MKIILTNFLIANDIKIIILSERMKYSVFISVETLSISYYVHHKDITKNLYANFQQKNSKTKSKRQCT